MHIYIYLDSDSLDLDEPSDLAVSLSVALAEWVTGREKNAEAIGLLADGETLKHDAVLGLHLQVKKPLHLKEPLNFLYDQARLHKCNFVLGLFEEGEEDGSEKGAREDICFFGQEEGKPDMYEVSSYIGLG